MSFCDLVRPVVANDHDTTAPREEWVEVTTVGDAAVGVRRYLSLTPPYGRERLEFITTGPHHLHRIGGGTEMCPTCQAYFIEGAR